MTVFYKDLKTIKRLSFFYCISEFIGRDICFAKNWLLKLYVQGISFSSKVRTFHSVFSSIFFFFPIARV